jgi:hypothetical protein
MLQVFRGRKWATTIIDVRNERPEGAQVDQVMAGVMTWTGTINRMNVGNLTNSLEFGSFFK